MKISTDRVWAVFNSDIAASWKVKDKRIGKVFGCDNPIKRELDFYLRVGLSLIDIGCGGGKLIEYVLRKSNDCNIVCLDISRKMIEAAKDITDELNHGNNRVHFIVGNVENCCFQENYFDIIILKQVLHHINEPSLILRKLGRLLKPNGLIIVMVPGLNYQKEFFSFSGDKGKDILGRFSVKGLEDQILKSSLFPVKLSIERFTFEFENFYDYLNFMKDIGSLQKLYNYEEKRFKAVFKMLEWYHDILIKTEKIQISGEYITAVCQKIEQWSSFSNKLR